MGRGTRVSNDSNFEEVGVSKYVVGHGGDVACRTRTSISHKITRPELKPRG